MEELLAILAEIVPGENLADRNDLVSGGFLTSFDIVRLVMELNDHYDIEISPIDIIPENFESVATIKSLVSRLAD